jgi:DNA ligase-1
MTTFKPLLAAKLDPKHPVKFPVYASVKLDGIRGLVIDGQLVSRSLKPIPNAHCRALFGRPELSGLDGELIVGPPNAQNAMQAATSGCMRHDGEPDVTFYVFDVHNRPELGYEARLEVVRAIVRANPEARLEVVNQELVGSAADLDSFEAGALRDGYEGAMIRSPHGLYRQGRATSKEGILTKLKRFEDEEAVVIDTVERMHNGNEPTVDNLGHTKRTSHQAGKSGHNDLGALTCVVRRGDQLVEFSIGTGFSAQQRKDFWVIRDQLVGKRVTFRHFAAAGVVAAPRFPVWVAFRHEDDLS